MCDLGAVPAVTSADGRSHVSRLQRCAHGRKTTSSGFCFSLPFERGIDIALCVFGSGGGDLYREEGRMQARLRIGTAPARVGVSKSLGCNKLSCTPFACWETALPFLDG